MNIDEEAFRIMIIHYSFDYLPWKDLMKWLEEELDADRQET